MAPDTRAKNKAVSGFFSRNFSGWGRKIPKKNNDIYTLKNMILIVDQNCPDVSKQRIDHLQFFNISYDKPQLNPEPYIILCVQEVLSNFHSTPTH